MVERTSSTWASVLTLVSLVCVLIGGAVATRADTARPSVSEMLLDWMKWGSEEWLRRAEQEYREGNLKEAVKAAEEAVRLRPGSAYTHRLLGYLYATLGQNREARAEFERAAIIEPKLRVTLADFYLAQAWAELEAQLRRDPNDPEIARRLRAVAALAELNPELKNLLRRQEEPVRDSAAAEKVPPVLLSESAPYALVVEKRSQTARLYRWTPSGITLDRTYPVTTGQVSGEKQRRGDMRTPDGVYTVQDLIPGDNLPEIYGAFALPLNYPNAWDRLRRRDGHGIWIHGSDRLTQPFRPRETRGCVVMREEDLLHLANLVRPQLTPVLIAEVVPYKSSRDWEQWFAPLRTERQAGELLAAALGPDYVAAIHRGGEQITRLYYARDRSWTVLAREAEPALNPEEWGEKIATVLPQSVSSLERIEIERSAKLPRLVIRTTQPARPRAFKQESADRLYLDLPGVRPGPVPETMEGDGAWIRQVKIGASHADPPVTRVVVDLYQPTTYRITTRGKETVVSLMKP
ncbi:MAG: L,D-transpeptidase family protein [Candidatus Binatia bacterium]|nr:L,D-transpeptidase family protein [Candidatus Binatia bacterium]